MANEITTAFKLSVTKGGVTITNATGTGTKTQTIQSNLTGVVHHTVQSVGHAEAEALSLGDVTLTADHMVLLINRDATNFVTVNANKSADHLAVCGKMLPGESWGPVRLLAQTASYPSITLQADTADCLVEVVACDAGDPTP
jgi:hypothetical protein